jgi:hypothetical protein
LAEIEQTILELRDQKVILDRDLARTYGVPTGVLNQAVRRNRQRFPPDFIFQLAKDEFDNWRSQFEAIRQLMAPPAEPRRKIGFP